jgi:hypothetical protein
VGKKTEAALAALEELAAEARQARKEKRDAVASLVAKAAKPAPKPAGPKPAPRRRPDFATQVDSSTPAEKLEAARNAAAGSAPCTLTREQLGPGPSEQMLRFARAARDKF